MLSTVGLRVHSMRFIFASLVLALLTLPVTYAEIPADKFDLRFWKLTLPLDDNNDGKVDEIKVGSLHKYSHPDFFYVDGDGYLVFAAPNKAITTASSTNTRSELRQMFRGKNTKIGTHDPRTISRLRHIVGPRTLLTLVGSWRPR